MKKTSFIAILFSFFHLQLSAQIPEYRNLVMEGGGIKGIAYGGAMAELENRGILRKIIRVAGTSAGAIQASLLAVGYSAEEISEIIATTPIESFNDDGFINKGTKRLINEYGWFRGEEFLSTMENLILNRTGNANLTFAQLHELAKSYPFRDLYVVGADLSDQKTVVFSYENYPDMRIADAVRISMSIPLYYKALWVNPKGKIIANPSPEDNCHLFVDGGILMNFPINIFDKTMYFPKNNQLGFKTEKVQEIFNTETIGFRLERCEQITHEMDKGGGIAPYEISDFNSYLSALSSILMRNVSPAHPRDVERTIYINDLGKSPRVRKVPENEKKEMMISGRQGVIDFFNRTNVTAD